ncbi:putative ephrin receptor [Fasciola hepatica]|uniref:Ephrin receptor n=1 Tax=Fasciola hepatica TaxID=6192 RepID=A0A4E0RNB6_FASHE|nr:putative ephrin receptor [Fasciola hepatica]
MKRMFRASQFQVILMRPVLDLWRQQSRAGSGQLVYSVCEAILPRTGGSPWKSGSKQPKQLVLSSALQSKEPFGPKPLEKLPDLRTGTTDATRLTPATDDAAEYWLVSPTFDSNQILSVHVHIVYQMQDCPHDANGMDQNYKAISRCREDFDVMLHQFDRWDNVSRLESFRKITELTSGSNDLPVTGYTGNDLVKILHANFRPTGKRFRLALRDTGACVLVDQLIMFYLHCPETEVNLMHLPQTPAGHNAEIRFVPGKCVPGAKHSPGPTTQTNRNVPTRAPGAFCMVTGKWHLDDDEFQCVCEPGYEMGQKGMKCETCLRGTFKSNTGNDRCHVCPLNSIAPTPGQLQCACLPGYFRLTRISSPNYPCFGPPSSPRNLNAAHINGTAVELTWDQPIRSGGLEDIHFHVICQGCVPHMVNYSPSDRLNGTRVFVSGLQPLTRYQFDVYAQNEASSLADALWSNVASMIVTTRSGSYTNQRTGNTSTNGKPTLLAPTTLTTPSSSVEQNFIRDEQGQHVRDRSGRTVANGNAEEKIITTGLVLSIALALIMGSLLIVALVIACVPGIVKRCPPQLWACRKSASDSRKIFDNLGPVYQGWMKRSPSQEGRAGPKLDNIPLRLQWTRKPMAEYSDPILISSPGSSPLKEHRPCGTGYNRDSWTPEEQQPVWLQMICLQSNPSGAENRQNLGSINGHKRFPVIRNLGKWTTKKKEPTVYSKRDQLLRDTIRRNMQLNHPGIIQTYGVILTQGHPMIVCQWMPAGCLADLLDQVLKANAVQTERDIATVKNELVVTMDRYISILVDVSGGLKYLHEKHVFYQNLTTKDVFLDRQYRCRLRVPIRASETITMATCNQEMKDFQPSPEAVFTNDFNISSRSEMPIDLSAPGSFSRIINPFKSGLITTTSPVTGYATRLEQLKSAGHWTTVTLSRPKISTPFFSNILLNNQYAFLSDINQSSRMKQNVQLAGSLTRQVDNSLKMFHQLVQRLQTRTMETFASQSSNEVDAWLHCDPDLDMVANDIWCFGNIVIELLIAHIVQCHPDKWQSSLLTNDSELASVLGPCRQQFSLPTHRSSRKLFPHLINLRNSLKLSKRLDQIQNWADLIQWCDSRGFQLIGIGRLLELCRNPCRNQRLRANELHEMCSIMQQHQQQQRRTTTTTTTTTKDLGAYPPVMSPSPGTILSKVKG